MKRPRPTIEVHGVDFVDAGAPVRLEAAAAAHDGARVERVEFLVDGAVVGVDTEAPYEVTWTAGGTGRHIFQGTAHHSQGRVAESAPVNVFIGIRALERSIARGEDEAEERLDGRMNLSQNNGLSLVEGRGVADSVVGLRFADIRIPRGTPIQEAYLQFTVGLSRTEPTDLTLHAELAGDAVAFTEVSENISAPPADRSLGALVTGAVGSGKGTFREATDFGSRGADPGSG